MSLAISYLRCSLSTPRSFALRISLCMPMTASIYCISILVNISGSFLQFFYLRIYSSQPAAAPAHDLPDVSTLGGIHLRHHTGLLQQERPAVILLVGGHLAVLA